MVGQLAYSLDALADVLVGEHIHGQHFTGPPQACRICTAVEEKPQRGIWEALHVQHHRVGGDLFVNDLLNVHRDLANS